MTELVQFPCTECGAQLEYAPGTSEMRCPYCGQEQVIGHGSTIVEELPLHRYLDNAAAFVSEDSEKSVRCDSCGAQFSIGSKEVNKDCPFCGSEVLTDLPPGSQISPNGLLPFKLKAVEARTAMGTWLGSRFWAPNDLKRMALREGQLHGMYLPFWTYDSATTTDYTGRRGEYYYETETYTVNVNGQSQTRTRSVRRTRWYPASGSVFVAFDDVLVLATDRLQDDHAARLESWDLQDLTTPEKGFIAGFQTMRYDVDLGTGFGRAQAKMQPAIDSAIRSDIGGDVQEIFQKRTSYDRNTFKHLLLPVWAGAYRYRQKSFRFVVNGRTGEVAGSAPVSVWKVLLAVLLGLILVAGIAYLSQASQNSASESPTQAEQWVPAP